MRKRRPMVAAAVSVLAGCVASTAIAAACASWSRLASSPRGLMPVTESPAGLWGAGPVRGFGISQEEWRARKRTFGPSGAAALTAPERAIVELLALRLANPHVNESDFVLTAALVETAGWPLPAFRSASLTVDTQVTTLILETRGGVAIPRNGRNAVGQAMYRRGSGLATVPLRPVWTGLLGNTALFAAAVLVVLRAPAAIRRRVRKRRGWCLSCGYDLRGNVGAGCPECGLGKAGIA